MLSILSFVVVWVKNGLNILLGYLACQLGSSPEIYVNNDVDHNWLPCTFQFLQLAMKEAVQRFLVGTISLESTMDECEPVDREDFYK